MDTQATHRRFPFVNLDCQSLAMQKQVVCQFGPSKYEDARKEREIFSKPKLRAVRTQSG